MQMQQKIKLLSNENLGTQANEQTIPSSKGNKCAIGNCSNLKTNDHAPSTYHYQQEEKIIPGYNFQSLFRKKSHIKLSKKKNREEITKRNVSQKHQTIDKQKNIQKGHWTIQQNKLYHIFLEIHSRHFVLKHLRRTDKIFKSMANFMKSRQAQQCRSHHQKMEKKYHNFYQILMKLRMDLYNSLDTEDIIRQIQEKGLKIKQTTLLTGEQLKNGDVTSKQVKQDNVQDSEQSIISYENDNILSENYEKDLDFNKMHFQP